MISLHFRDCTQSELVSGVVWGQRRVGDYARLTLRLLMAAGGNLRRLARPRPPLLRRPPTRGSMLIIPP